MTFYLLKEDGDSLLLENGDFIILNDIFYDPENIYSADDVYTTGPSSTGILGIEVSKDGGTNWSSKLYKTFTGTETVMTYGSGATELWGLSWTLADMVDANFRIRISNNGNTQIYKDLGFSTGIQVLTGIEIVVEGKLETSTLYLDHLKVRVYYGNSPLTVRAGSQVYASNGRKVGEGAGAGTGTLVYYDGDYWRRTGDDTTVAA
jgi:hypothetical protein